MRRLGPQRRCVAASMYRRWPPMCVYPSAWAMLARRSSQRSGCTVSIRAARRSNAAWALRRASSMPIASSSARQRALIASSSPSGVRGPLAPSEHRLQVVCGVPDPAREMRVDVPRLPLRRLQVVHRPASMLVQKRHERGPFLAVSSQHLGNRVGAHSTIIRLCIPATIQSGACYRPRSYHASRVTLVNPRAQPRRLRTTTRRSPSSAPTTVALGTPLTPSPPPSTPPCSPAPAAPGR